MDIVVRDSDFEGVDTKATDYGAEYILMSINRHCDIRAFIKQTKDGEYCTQVMIFKNSNEHTKYIMDQRKDRDDLIRRAQE